MNRELIIKRYFEKEAKNRFDYYTPDYQTVTLYYIAREKGWPIFDYVRTDLINVEEY